MKDVTNNISLFSYDMKILGVRHIYSKDTLVSESGERFIRVDADIDVTHRHVINIVPEAVWNRLRMIKGGDDNGQGCCICSFVWCHYRSGNPSFRLGMGGTMIKDSDWVELKEVVSTIACVWLALLCILSAAISFAILAGGSVYMLHVLMVVVTGG